MSVQESPVGYVERCSGLVCLRYRPGTYAAERLEALAARAQRVARHLERRLKSLSRPAGAARIVLTLVSPPEEALPAARDPLISSEAWAEPSRVLVTPESPGRDLGERVALQMIRERFGGAEIWEPPADQADAAAIRNALQFLSVGLARYLAAEAEMGDGGFLVTGPDGAPRQTADQVVRQSAADRDGKVPLYECLLRGASLASSPPEYAALAQSFCGYLFEREGAKAYRRFVRDSSRNPNDAADLVYGKTLEELQDEWLRAVLLGQTRRPVTLKGFIRQVIPYLRPYTWLVIVALALMLFSAGVAQVVPFTVRDIIDIVAQAAGKVDSSFWPDLMALPGGGGLGWEAFSAKHTLELNTLGRLYAKIAVLALAVFINLCSITWLVYVVNVIGQNILRDLRVRFTQRLHSLGAGFYSRHRMGDMLSRFTSDIARMADPLAEAVAYSIYYLIFLVFTTFSMFAMSWQLSLVLILIIPTYFIINRRFGPTMQIAARTRQERLAQLNANLEEMLFGHHLIKAYGLGNHMLGRFQPKIGEYRKVAIWADFLRAVYNEIIGIAENLQTKLVLAVGGTLAVFGVISTGTIVGFNGLAGRFISPLHKLGVIYAAVAMASASLRRVEEILREPMEVMDTPPGGTYSPGEIREGITFQNVSFSYTGAEPTLQNINLTIPAGSKVAFVGPTGAGKSTLVNLIPRFYDVDQGAVLIDGRDIRSFSLAGLRQSISVVSQDTFIFNATILENIRFGRLDATDEEVIEAARGASLHEFIESLPAGYDTLVGERGGRLSGGQRQRVAIARALLRNSPILILDEATSALDAETETEILSELDAITEGKTVISITHRLGLALKADTICVLQDGRIVERGSHEELFRAGGLYRRLFEDQNRELMRRSADKQLEVTVSRVRVVPTFSLVPVERVAEVAHLLATVRYAPGEVVCEPNGDKGGLYLLRDGQLEVTVQDGAGGQSLQVGTPNGVGGGNPLALLLSLPAAASARAVTDAEVVVLDREDLRGLLGTAWFAADPDSTIQVEPQAAAG